MIAAYVENESSRVLGGFIKPVSNRRFTFESPSGNSLMEAFIGDPYKDNFLNLKKIAVALDQDVFCISYQQALREVCSNMKDKSGSIIVAHALEPRLSEERGLEKIVAMSSRLASSVVKVFNGEGIKPVVGFSEMGYIGYSTQQLWTLTKEKRSWKILYMSTMAVLPGYRRMGMGARFIGIANSLYNPDILLFRTRSGALKSCLTKSKLGEGSVYPFDEPYDKDKDPVMAATLDLADEKTVHPNPIERSRGLTKAVYTEERDFAYQVDRTHSESSQAFVQMIEWGLDPDNGDAIHMAVRVIGRQKGVEILSSVN